MPQKHKISVETKCDPVTIEAELAVPLGLVTNEFVTNSLKHAAADRDVVISLNLCVEEDNLVIKLADNGKGIGIALQEKSKEGGGSGLMLIEGLLAQIKSEWKWTSQKGTQLSIKIPLSVKVLHP